MRVFFLLRKNPDTTVSYFEYLVSKYNKINESYLRLRKKHPRQLISGILYSNSIHIISHKRNNSCVHCYELLFLRVIIPIVEILLIHVTSNLTKPMVVLYVFIFSMFMDDLIKKIVETKSFSGYMQTFAQCSTSSHALLLLLASLLESLTLFVNYDCHFCHCHYHFHHYHHHYYHYYDVYHHHHLKVRMSYTRTVLQLCAKAECELP